MKLLIAQLSDSHIDLMHPQRIAELENCVRCINAEAPQPALVVHTGDITHNGLAEEYSLAKKALDKLNAPYCVLAGNKDDRQELLRFFADELHLNKDSDWIQYSFEQQSTRLLILDTVHNHSNKGEICPERFVHIKQLLEADRHKPCAIFMHHPPFEASSAPDPFQYEDWSQALQMQSLLADYPTVCGVYCGHIHRNIDCELSGISASAITCLAGDLRKGEVSDEERSRPVYRMIQLP